MTLMSASTLAAGLTGIPVVIAVITAVEFIIAMVLLPRATSTGRAARPEQLGPRALLTVVLTTAACLAFVASVLAGRPLPAVLAAVAIFAVLILMQPRTGGARQ